MSLPQIDASKAHSLIDAGALLVDVREAHEYAAEHIGQAQNLPLSSIATARVGDKRQSVIFHCKSGARTQMNAALLKKVTAGEAYVLDGGIEAWKRAGLPVTRPGGQQPGFLSRLFGRSDAASKQSG